MSDLVVIDEANGLVVVQEIAPADILEVVAAGPQGPSGTMTVGTVTTVATNVPAAVVNVGTPTSAIWNFTIPKGETGDITPQLQALADSAATSATSAGNSATSAGNSATAAATSATNAANSATSAAGSATTATTKASEASTSASNAAASATAASTSATSASNSATAAATSATAASDSKTAAANSATTASTAATNAANSATAAANSATAAGTSETNAANSATAAAGSATTASTAATNAGNSATSAANSATAAAQSAIDAADASRLTVGTVTTVAVGGTATATITGAPGSQLLNLGLVTGPKGDTGDHGPSNVFTGSTPPASPEDGWKWIDPASGVEYTWFTDADSSQWVETGAGGAVVNGGGGTATLDVSDTDFTNATYYYYGGLLGSAWQINRYERATITKTTATVSNNPTVANLAAAWPDRATLTYA